MIDGFILTRQWFESATGVTLDLWFATDDGACRVQVTGQEAVLFIQRSDADAVTELLSTSASSALARHWRQAEVHLKNFHNQPVNALYLRSQRQLRELRQLLEIKALPCWEADIRPAERYLMERFVTGGCRLQHTGNRQPPDVVTDTARKPWRNPRFSPSDYRPRLKVVSLDIETSMDASCLFSIAVWAEGEQRVFMIDEQVVDEQGESAGRQLQAIPGGATLVYCRSERECLQQFLIWLGAFDPDVLIGWNLVQFDLWVLEQLCQKSRVPFRLGRAAQKPIWRQDEGDSDRRYITIPGRVALDGIELLKAATYHFDSYSLEAVARVLLGQGKLLSGSGRGEDIAALFQTNKVQLAAYNLRDCELVWDIFSKMKLLEFAIERSQLTGLLMDRIGGSVASFEYAYLPRLHRAGYVAPNLGELQSDIVSPGGYVMDSQPGIYDNVLVLDFKSLYPSIIRSFKIDPCGFWLAQHQGLADEEVVPGFNGASFSRQGHILPGVIENLWQARDQAKAEQNAPLSQAIKIIMNSFYGVLGSTGCRFYDPRVCSSITLRGHEIIQRSREWIEARGYRVIYGDTDSVFVWLNRDCSAEQARECGAELAEGLNQWWTNHLADDFGVQSALEIEFETHYQRFLMPTIRGSEKGSKKRYAGVIDDADGQRIVFKGLENVRTDWTPIAKAFQEKLYRRVFFNQIYVDYIRQVVADVMAGRCDKQLIYRKRLRRHLDDYQKNVPPHVRAARMLEKARGEVFRRGDWIEYVITVNGPEPILARVSPIDYGHYVEKQLAPVADSILHFLGASFHGIIDQQLGLFVGPE